ncbi:MAG TPA: LLM class flavin-dependent oxidoreductase [Acidimicrobiales bacterium]|nr:LLM class flavin-dependent oxidoreductase [Acidimicrobiales bacterium]
MRVGLMIVPYHPMDTIRFGLSRAEELDVDSVWVPDHLLGVFHPALWPDMPGSAVSADPDSWYDSFVCLGAIGQESELPMGTCVTDTARRRAADVARTALTLHHICKGGFNLGLGAGEAENLLPFGYDFSAPVAVAEEFLIELRSLLDHGTMPTGALSGRLGIPSREGLGKPKVWVAGHGPRMLRLTGQYADGWLPAWPMSPSIYAQRRALIADHARRAGRSNPVSGLFIPVIIGESRDYVAELMEKEPLAKLSALICSAEVWAEHGMEHPSGPDSRGLVDLVIHEMDPEMLREVAPNIPFELVEEFTFIGNDEEVRERIAPYREVGLELVVLADTTGAVGGLGEIEANAGRFSTLVTALGAT